MKYFLDTEFLQGPQTKRFLGIPYGKTKPTIDLISIGIVAEDGREYYAISKDFNLKEAWNRFELKKVFPDDTEEGSYSVKVYWIRENVLKPIWQDLFLIGKGIYYQIHAPHGKFDKEFTYKNLKKLLNKYGKTNKCIAEEIKRFIPAPNYTIDKTRKHDFIPISPQFYAYFGAYDYVVFSQLFGGFENYPKHFPQSFTDLQQEEENAALIEVKKFTTIVSFGPFFKYMKDFQGYPKQTNEHHALSDARWNKELHEFLNKL